MRKILIFWSISILIMLFIGIKFMVGGNSNASGMMFEIVLFQIALLIIASIWHFRKSKNVA